VVAALAVCVATFTVGLIHLAPCAAGSWWSPPEQYADHCWSALPYDYAGGGLAERTPPLQESSGRTSTYSPPVAVAGYGAALATAWVSGRPDVTAAGSRPVREAATSEEIRAEAVTYTGLVSLLMLLAALVSVFALARTHRSRPWDAMAFAGAPALVLTAVMGWDLAAVALTCAAMWAWSQRRATLTGVLAGVGVATAWWPAVVAGAAVVLCLRARQTNIAVRVAAATVAGFAIVVLPALLLARDGLDRWLATATDFSIEEGSTWHLGALDGGSPPQWLVPVGLAVVVLAVTALTLCAPQPPRLAQVALLGLLGALLVHGSHEPQTVLWLLPLAALARPRWRDLVLWQTAEILYVVAYSWHLHGYTVPESGDADLVLTLAMLSRILAEVTLAAVVVRDVLRPWMDPVRAGGQDDPAGGVLEEAAVS
jgi:hypothetical protein